MFIYNINVDLLKDNFTYIKCKQNDDLVLKLSMFNNSITENMNGYSVIVNALRSNNTFVKQSEGITTSGNIISIDLVRDITRVSGEVILEVVLTKDNKQKTSFNIKIDVVSSVIKLDSEMSKNVITIIEQLDGKIAEIQDMTNKTITTLNQTKIDVENIKNTTITETTKIKNTAITDMTNIKVTAVTDLTKIKDEAIGELNKWNIGDHVNNLDIHTTKLEKEQIEANKKDLQNLKEELKDTTLDTFTTDQVITPLTGCIGGMVSIDKVQGKTMYKRADGTLTDVWEVGVTLESAGEKQANNQYKIEILSEDRNGNIYNEMKNNSDIGFNYGNTTIKNNNGIVEITAPLNSYNFAISKQKIMLAPNTNYTLSVKGYKANGSTGAISIVPVWNTDQNPIAYMNLTTTNSIITKTFNSGNRTECYILYYPNVSVDTSSYMALEYVQLEKGTTATEYKNYKGDKTEILMQQPLREWDSIDNNGVVNRDSYQAIINDTLPWVRLGALNENNCSLFWFNSTDSKPSINDNSLPANLKCAEFKTVPTDRVYDTDDEGIGISVDNTFGLRVLNSRTGILPTDSDEVKLQKFKTWLASNKFIVECELKDSLKYTENSNKTLVLTGYKDGSLVVNSGSVNPTVTGTYATNLGERMSSVEDGLGNMWKTVLTLADKELGMKNISLLTTETTTDLKNKVNEIINIWK